MATMLGSSGTLYRRHETVEIHNFYEEPPSHSDGSYILSNSFSFRYYFICDEIEFIPSSQRLSLSAIQSNLVCDFYLLRCIHVSRCLQEL